MVTIKIRDERGVLQALSFEFRSSFSGNAVAGAIEKQDKSGNDLSLFILFELDTKLRLFIDNKGILRHSEQKFFLEETLPSSSNALSLLENVSQGNTIWSIVYDTASLDFLVAMGKKYDQVHRFNLKKPASAQ
jgi:hypothetical protein